MLESSFGLGFFLKRPKIESREWIVYFRITVDGIRRKAQLRENGIIHDGIKGSKERSAQRKIQSR